MKKLLSILLVAMMLLSSVTALAEDWTCPSCGNTTSGNFCNNCGSAKPADDWTCPSCGNNVTGKFCNNCGTARPANDTAIETVEAEPTITPSPVATAEGYVVSSEYTWGSMWGNYYAMVLKNTSGSKCGFDIQLVFKDKADGIVGVSNPSVTVCDDGYEVMVTASCDVAFDHVEYNITPTQSSWYNDVHSFVEVTAQKVGDKAIIKAVNTGTVDADFVEYNCLFLKGDKVVSSGWGFLVDNNSQLKSGMTELREEACYEDFDSIVVFFQGRTDKSVVNTGSVEVAGSSSAACEGAEVTHEYAWSSFWSNSYAIVVKNISGKSCGFNAQVIFYDKDNNIVGVANPSITICGDGYEVLMIASQDAAYDHVEYTITPADSSWYEDVHNFVEVTATKSGDKAILTAKNNGTKNAEFVEYNCLFLDKDGNVVGSDWGFLTDNDSEIKPGKMEMREASPYVDFDSVVIYYEGRCSK